MKENRFDEIYAKVEYINKFIDAKKKGDISEDAFRTLIRENPSGWAE